LSRDRFSPFEFALIIAIAFGWPILGSLVALSSGHTVGEPGTREAFGAPHLYSVVVSELICFPILATLLHVRGWRLNDFPLGIGKAATLLGVILAVAAWSLDFMFEAALRGMSDSLRASLDSLGSYRPSSPPDLVAVYLLSVVNPVFEEVFVCGYVISALSPRFGPTAAVNVSAIIRGTYHLYQGVAMAPFHFSYGLIQAYVFVRFGKLWPLIVSHAILDFIALLYLF
jgi:uncharacterized protein